MPVRGQGILHHHLHQNITHKYCLLVRPLHSPSCTHIHTHIHAWWNISIAFTHPHIQAEIPKNTPATTLQTLATPHPARPPTAGWARPQFGSCSGFLTLGCECYLFSECSAVRGARWEVGTTTDGRLSRSMVLKSTCNYVILYTYSTQECWVSH